MASPLVSKAEKSYIQTGLKSSPPLRLDGRGLHDFRAVALETGVTPLANGSARVSIGKSPHDGGGGTEVLAAAKLEVEDVNEGGVTKVEYSPVAYPHLPSSSLDDLQHDMAALWDTKVPRTRRVEYRTRKGGSSGVKWFDTRKITNATDFELSDYWDEGEILDGRDRWPVCVTLNLAPPIHYLDALSQEEASTMSHLLLAFSFPRSSAPTLQAMRMLGPGELDLTGLKNLVKDGEKYALGVHTA
ncbi:hypothetical protein BD779DRAFT_1612494 [Infundibulicybe gibba]|nr:hypothetical protein BD779DRAFT_1612494 [Infundibulicybe gibba]